MSMQFEIAPHVGLDDRGQEVYVGQFMVYVTGDDVQIKFGNPRRHVGYLQDRDESTLTWLPSARDVPEPVRNDAVIFCEGKLSDLRGRKCTVTQAALPLKLPDKVRPMTMEEIASKLSGN